MKYFVTLAVLFFSVPVVFAQSGIETDIFGDLDYTARDGDYTATLKKNIFSDLVFSDSKDNEVVFEKKYLDREFSGIHQNKRRKTDLLMRLIREHGRDKGYHAKYSIDIFDKLIIENNRGYKLEEGKDIFGHNSIEEEIGGVKTSVKRNIHGDLEYTVGKDEASLKKDIFNVWNYEDSFGNVFKFGAKTWQKLIKRYGNDEGVFLSIIDRVF